MNAGALGHRVEDPLNAGADPLLGRPALAAGGRGLRGAGEVEQVRALGFVELKRPGQGVKHAVGDPAGVPPLEAGVVVDADPSEHGDLFAAQAGNAAVVTVDREPYLIRGDLGAPGGEELTNLRSGVHTLYEATRTQAGLGGPVSTCINRDSQFPRIGAFLEKRMTKNRANEQA